jgi:hypothetical protein
VESDDPVYEVAFKGGRKESRGARTAGDVTAPPSNHSRENAEQKHRADLAASNVVDGGMRVGIPLPNRHTRLSESASLARVFSRVIEGWGSLVERFGVDYFHKAVIVSVIQGNADQDRTLERTCLAIEVLVEELSPLRK